MTTLLTAPKAASLAVYDGLARRRPAIEDVDQDAGERPLVSPAAAEANRLALDTAIHMNRAQTPRAVMDQRHGPRYSVSELNDMDLDAIRERFERMPKLDYDPRPGIVKFLDLLDLPRNALYNGVTAMVMPDVRRKAIERGDEGTFGIPRVTGADVLRGMGISNTIVAGVGGFAMDVVGDPLSWLFAPAKGVSLVGKGGKSIAMGATGANALQRSLRQVAKGGIDAVEDDFARRMFKATVAVHKLDEADPRALQGLLRAKLIGDEGRRVRRAVSAVFGPSGRGGDIVERAFQVVDDTAGNLARTPEAAEQIRAVKGFVDQYTLNRGVQIGGRNAGTVVGHVPLTDISLTVPAFTRGGRDAVIQRAVAAALDGDTAKAAVLGQSAGLLNRFRDLANRSQELSDRERAILRTIDGDETIAEELRNAQPTRVVTGFSTENGDVYDLVDGPTRTTIRSGPSVKGEINQVPDSLTGELKNKRSTINRKARRDRETIYVSEAASQALRDVQPGESVELVEGRIVIKPNPESPDQTPREFGFVTGPEQNVYPVQYQGSEADARISKIAVGEKIRRVTDRVDSTRNSIPSETTLPLSQIKPDGVQAFSRAALGLDPKIAEQLTEIEQAAGVIDDMERLRARAYRYSRSKQAAGGYRGINAASMQAGDTFAIGPDPVRVLDADTESVRIAIGAETKILDLPGMGGPATVPNDEVLELVIPRDAIVPANRGTYSALKGRPATRHPLLTELEDVRSELGAIEKGLRGGWRRVSEDDTLRAAVDPLDMLDDELDEAARLADDLLADQMDEEAIARFVGKDAMGDRGLLQSLDEIKNQLMAQQGFRDVNSIGDLLAITELGEEIRATRAQALAAAQWKDAERTASRLTESGTAYVRRLQEQATMKAANDLDLDLETTFDDLADDTSRMQALKDARDAILARERGRFAEHVHLSESDLNSAEQVARAFGAYVEATQLAADYALAPVRTKLGRDARELAAGALLAAGLDRRIVGHLPFQSLAAVARRDERGFGQAGNVLATVLGGPDRLERIGRTLTESFGQGESAFNATRAAAARAHSTAGDAGSQVVTEVLKGSERFGRGLEKIAADHGVQVDDKLLALLSAIVTANRAVDTHFTTFMGKPSAAVRAVIDARESGILRNEALRGELTDLAERIGSYVDAQGWQAVQFDDLSLLQPLEGSAGVPVALAPEAAQRLRDMKGGAGPLRGTGDGGGTPSLREGFQKPRATWQVQYRDPTTGLPRDFLVMDKAIYGRLSDQDLTEWAAILGQDTANFARQQRDAVRDFERAFGSIDDEAVVRTHGRPLDSHTLNELFSSGAMRNITGSVFDGDVFSTNILDLLSRRATQVRAHEAVDDFIEAVVDMPQAIRGRPDAFAQIATQKGTQFTMNDGTVATVVGDGKRILIGDTTYRPIEAPPELMAKLAGPRGMFRAQQTFYPEPVAQNIERFFSQMKPERVSGILRTANEFTKVWRAQTLFHPSWVTINTVGNAMLLFMDHRGIHAPTLAKKLNVARRIAAAHLDPQKLRSITVNVGGQTYTGEDIWKIAQAERVAQGGNVADARQQVMRAFLATERQAGQTQGVVRRPLRGIAANYQQRVKQATAARRAQAAPTRGEAAAIRLGAAADALGDAGFRRIFETWFRLNGNIDDTFRMASMLQHMENGSDAVSAARQARRGMLDFGDLTDFERNTIRAFVPFYSWLKASLPNMLGRLATDPTYFTAINRTRDLVEEISAGEEKLPWHMRPRWIQQQLGLQIGKDYDGRLAAIIGTALPQEQALRTVTGALGAVSSVLPFDTGFGGQDVMDSLGFLVGQQSPITKSAIELAQGRELFSGRTIGATPEEGDLSLQEYLIGQIRWARELGIGSVRSGALPSALDQGLGAAAGRILVGGRLQPGLQEDRRLSSLSRELNERVASTRKAIRVAEREGDAVASLRARTILMKHYRDHIRSGGSITDVPKWAIRQLRQAQLIEG